MMSARPNEQRQGSELSRFFGSALSKVTWMGRKVLLLSLMALAIAMRAKADGVSVNNPPGQIQVSFGGSENTSVTVESTLAAKEFTVVSDSFFDVYTSITALAFTFQANEQTILLQQGGLPFTSSLTSPIVINGGYDLFNAVEDYTTGGNTFDVSGFNPILGTMTNHGTAENSIVFTTSANVTLADNALTRGGSIVELSGFGNASLTMTGATSALDVTGWTGAFHLTANVGSRVLIAGSVELSNAVNNGTLVFNSSLPSASASSATGLSGNGSVEVANGGTLVLNGSVASGAPGTGDGFIGGNGGVGVLLDAGGVLNTGLSSTISGGSAVLVSETAGNGGAGVSFNGSGTMNAGPGTTITGGNGGDNDELGGSVGNGGTAIVFNAGGALVNEAGATITAGQAGSGWDINNNRIYGARGLGVIFQGGAGNLTNAGTINGDVSMGNFANTVTLVEGGIINGNLTLGTNAGSTLYLTANGNRTYSSSITGSTKGSGSLFKDGPGVLTIDQPLDLSGGIFINRGAVFMANALVAGPLTIASTSTTFSIGYVDGITVPSPIVSQTDAILSVGNSASATQQGGISESGGSHGLTKVGTGTLVLSGASSYSGGTIITGGWLVAGNSSAFGSGSVRMAASANGLGYLDGVAIPNPIVLTSNSSLHVGGNAAATQQGVVSDSGGAFGLTKVGTGSLTLSGANLYAGSTIANDGLLIAANNAAFSTGTLIINASGAGFGYSNGVTIPNSLTLQSNGTLYVGRNATGTQDGIISESGGSYGVTKAGEGTLVLPRANTYSGGTSLSGGALVATSNASLGTGAITFMGGTLKYAPGLTFDFSSRFSTAPGQQFSIDTNGNNLTFQSDVRSNGGSFTKLGEGLLNLSGANSLSAGVTVARGSLQLGSGTHISGKKGANAPTILADGGNGGNGVSIAADGTLTNQTDGFIAGGNGGNAQVGSGGVGGNGVVFQAGGSLINLAGASITGGNGGANNWEYSASGTGVVFQGGIGNLTNAGTINKGVSMGNYANRVTLVSGGVINGDLNMGNHSGATLTLDGTGSQTYSAAVTGTTTFSGSLVKNGAGRWTLDTPLAAPGGTTITAGELNVASTLAGAVAVASGAKLGGSGAVAGAVSVQSGGALRPGGLSILTVNGSVVLSSGATAAFSIGNSTTTPPTAGTNYDQVAILSGTPGAIALSIVAGATLQINNLASLQLNTVPYVPDGPNANLANYFVFSLQNGLTSGRFDFVSDGVNRQAVLYAGDIGVAAIGGTELVLSYRGNAATNTTIGGQDLVITAYAVPEPSVVVLLVIGLGLLLVWARKDGVLRRAA